MKEWLLSVVGVVFLSILFDLICPNGKINKFSKSIFGVVAIAIILSPILNIKFDISSDEYIDSTLVENINKSKAEVYKNQIEGYLKTQGVIDTNVEVNYTLSENDFEITFVYVDVSNVVLSENLSNINKYEVIANMISQKFNISEEKILIYG